MWWLRRIDDGAGPELPRASARQRDRLQREPGTGQSPPVPRHGRRMVGEHLRHARERHLLLLDLGEIERKQLQAVRRVPEQIALDQDVGSGLGLGRLHPGALEDRGGKAGQGGGRGTWSHGSALLATPPAAEFDCVGMEGRLHLFRRRLRDDQPQHQAEQHKTDRDEEGSRHDERRLVDRPTAIGRRASAFSRPSMPFTKSTFVWPMDQLDWCDCQELPSAVTITRGSHDWLRVEFETCLICSAMDWLYPPIASCTVRIPRKCSVERGTRPKTPRAARSTPPRRPRRGPRRRG